MFKWFAQTESVLFSPNTGQLSLIFIKYKKIFLTCGMEVSLPVSEQFFILKISNKKNGVYSYDGQYYMSAPFPSPSTRQTTFQCRKKYQRVPRNIDHVLFFFQTEIKSEKLLFLKFKIKLIPPYMAANFVPICPIIFDRTKISCFQVISIFAS